MSLSQSSFHFVYLEINPSTFYTIDPNAILFMLLINTINILLLKTNSNIFIDAIIEKADTGELVKCIAVSNSHSLFERERERELP